ncbi:MAG TPA: SpoIIE family protein phosphatase [Vicinamibacterales bacterium]
MITAADAYFRTELIERRHLLAHAARDSRHAELRDLLADVDAALARLDQGTFGICDVCHEYIGTRHLEHDPLARCCEEHPTPAEETRIHRDLALAHDLQLGLLPRHGLAIDGWQFRYRYEAASEVGGDFCDVIQVPARNETIVLVGDVSGKGVAASLLMSSLLATFRSLSSLALPTGELLSRVNALFNDSAPRSSYATLAAATLLPDGAVDLYSAGHWPPLLGRGGAAKAVAVEAGLPLGMFPVSTYASTRVALSPDDTLLFYTDGAIDAENGGGEDYSAPRLARAFGTAAIDPLDTLIDRCLQDVRRFQDGQPATDDLLLFALRTRNGATFH